MSIFTKPFMVLLCCLFILVGSADAQEVTVVKPYSQLKNDSLLTDSLRNLKQLIYFNTPKKLSTTSSAMVLGKEFNTTPVVAYPLALAGRLAGLSVSQGNGEPLNEVFSYRLRGQSPLIFIDGIPRSVTEISMEEIESVTVLKDAVSLAMLGVRGAGGAISIVTKKGTPGKQQISFTGQWGTQKPLQNLISNPLSAFNYAQLYNEAVVNDGLSVASNGFSETALTGFQTGNNPYLYPNVDWRDQVLKNSATIM
jgi:TonB-dependent SusC/RagA subfamily outer membrane receptor